MGLPNNVLQIRDAYVRVKPVPTGGPNPADENFENRCRAWTRGLAQQIVFSTGDRTYGCKSADPGRPQSKDAIAQKTASSLLGWDMLGGVGTGSPTLVADPATEDITGQNFIAVEPVDYIGGAGPGPTPPPDNDATDARQDREIQELQSKVAALEGQLADCLRYGSKIALRAWGHPEQGLQGFVLCAESGGPVRSHIQFTLTSRPDPGPWETWTIERGA